LLVQVVIVYSGAGPDRFNVVRCGTITQWLERLELFYYCRTVHTKLKWSLPINEHTLYIPAKQYLVTPKGIKLSLQTVSLRMYIRNVSAKLEGDNKVSKINVMINGMLLWNAVYTLFFFFFIFIFGKFAILIYLVRKNFPTNVSIKVFINCITESRK
jgi:hypothetical protein